MVIICSQTPNKRLYKEKTRNTDQAGGNSYFAWKKEKPDKEVISVMPRFTIPRIAHCCKGS